MKLCVVLFLVGLGSSCASRLMSTDDLQSLFTKFFNNVLTDEDHGLMQEVVEIFRRPEYLDSRSLFGSSQTRQTLDCILCRSAFSAFFFSVQSGQTDDQLTETVSLLCTNLGIENHKVCHGAVKLNIPILSYIVKNTPEATGNAFCSLLLQNSQNPNVCAPVDDARIDWTVELPERSKYIATWPMYNAASEPLTVAIVTDAHIDPLYEAYGVAECDEPTCCRKGQSPARHFLPKFVEEIFDEIVQIKSVGGELVVDLDVVPQLRRMRSERRNMYPARSAAPAPAGYWGDYRNCDTPLWAFDDVVDTITENHKNVDVVYYVGDTIDHGVWETSYELIDDMNRYIIDKIRKNFGDDVKVVPVIGNHESQPTNQFAPESVTGPKLNTTWLYEALARKWDFYLPDEAKESLLKRGDFSVLVKPGLRVISLNNNVAYRYNWWLVYDPSDGKRHLDWLVQELYSAEQAGEKVHILTHIPPGVHDLTYTWSREYNRIVRRFSSTIAAEFNGHTHTDEFKIYFDEAGDPINVAWGSGSATAYTFYNLNYKIATFDTDSYEPINMLNYVYNLTEANLTPNRRPHWFQLYDMKNTFRLPDLSPTSMQDLVTRMVTTDTLLLDKYVGFFSKLSDYRSWCNDDCRYDRACRTLTTVVWDRRKCEELLGSSLGSKASKKKSHTPK